MICHQLFLVVSSRDYKDRIWIGSMSHIFFVCYYALLSSHIESDSFDALPERFLLICDGQTTSGAHYMEVLFPIWLGIWERFLPCVSRCYQLEGETTQSSEDHIAFPELFLGVLKKKILKTLLLSLRIITVLISSVRTSWESRL